MKYQIRYKGSAGQDIAEIVAYWETERQSPTAASRIVAKVISRMDELAQAPRLYKRCELDERFHQMPVDNYLVF